jgi:hypothetical protein
MTVESLAKKDKIGRMRTKVICAMDEIVVSEKTYLTKLQELVEEILVPCQASDLFDSAEIATLFGNVRELMEYHKNFSFQLSQCEEIEHLTKVLYLNCYRNLSDRSFTSYAIVSPLQLSVLDII